MIVDDAIVVQLHENKYDFIVAEVTEDCSSFLQTNLHPCLYAFRKNAGDENALEAELLRLVQTKNPLKEEALHVVENWNRYDDWAMAKRCRALLYLAYAEFAQSEAFDLLCQRFELSLEDFFYEVDHKTLTGWLTLWMNCTYPQLTLLLFGVKVKKACEALGQIPLLQVVAYLPKFMLWNLLHSLSIKRIRWVTQQMALGCSIRKIDKVPFALSKKMVHYFITAPEELRFDDALWYSIVCAWGGTSEMAAIFKEHFGSGQIDETFVKTLVNFFRKYQNEIEGKELQQLLGYLQHRRDESWGNTLEGWTLQSLRIRAEEWYKTVRERRKLDKLRFGNKASWKGAPYLSRSFEYGESIFKIVQLTTAKELFHEGRALCHCVGSYVSVCRTKETSIWSLRLEGVVEDKSLVTIEVNRARVIVQMRTKYNAVPKPFYQELIQRWAKLEGLIVGC